MFYLFLSYGNTYGGIMELQPPEFLSINGVIIIAGILALAFYLAKHKKGVDWTRVYMAAGTLLMACMHLRNMWFTILGILPIFIFSLESWIPSKYKIYHTKKEYHILQAVYSLLICFLFICMWPVFQYKTEDSVLTPVEAVEYLDENGYTPENVVLFTEFNNGAFMEWNGYKTYIDARPELYQHEINGKYDLYDEYLALRSNQIDYDDFLEKYDFTHIIIGDSEPFNVYLEYSDDYELVVDGNGYDLYQKNNF